MKHIFFTFSFHDCIFTVDVPIERSDVLQLACDVAEVWSYLILTIWVKPIKDRIVQDIRRTKRCSLNMENSVMLLGCVFSSWDLLVCNFLF